VVRTGTYQLRLTCRPNEWVRTCQVFDVTRACPGFTPHTLSEPFRRDTLRSVPLSSVPQLGSATGLGLGPPRQCREVPIRSRGLVASLLAFNTASRACLRRGLHPSSVRADPFAVRIDSAPSDLNAARPVRCGSAVVLYCTFFFDPAVIGAVCVHALHAGGTPPVPFLAPGGPVSERDLCRVRS